MREPLQHKQESPVSLSGGDQVHNLRPVRLNEHGAQRQPLLLNFLKHTLLQTPPNNLATRILRIRTRLVLKRLKRVSAAPNLHSPHQRVLSVLLVENSRSPNQLRESGLAVLPVTHLKR